MDEPPTIDLPDGRALAYETYGRADGRPVFCLHGVPGSRLMWALFDDLAQRRDVRLVAPERPGFGRSDFQPGRTLLDWPDDVRELADDLGVDEFGVVGFSGGGPHALACAHDLPDRVRTTVLVSGVAPPDLHSYSGAYERGMTRATRSVPGFSRAAFGTASWLADHWRSRFRAAIVNGTSEPDRALFDGPEGDVLLEDAVEAFRGGGSGPAHEYPMLADYWGFDPADVEVPVALWHGRRDRSVDPDSSRALADALGDADLHLTDRGHYSTLVGEAEAILRAAAER